MVRVWTLLMNYVFRRRRVIIYLANGRSIKVSRTALNFHGWNKKPIDQIRQDIQEWMGGPSRYVIRFEERGRVVLVRSGDVSAVDIR